MARADEDRSMKYSPTWDLTTIPDAPLLSEASRRLRSRKRNFGGGRPIKRTRDPELAEKRRKNRENVAKWRAKQKGGER